MRKLCGELKICGFWVESDLGRFVKVQEVFLKQKKVDSRLALCFRGYSREEVAVAREIFEY